MKENHIIQLNFINLLKMLCIQAVTNYFKGNMKIFFGKKKAGESSS